MRIIAGEFRRRLLISPKDATVTRPMPDRVKESLFSILRGHCEGATVLDGFAGSGALGLEALSRGAKKCVFVERDRNISQILRDNVAALGCEDRALVIQGDALGSAALASAPRPLTLAFLDPPYPVVEDLAGFKRVMAQVQALVELLSDDGFVVLRTPWPLHHPVAPALPPPGVGMDPATVIENAGNPVPPDRTGLSREQLRLVKKNERGAVKKGRAWRRYADAMDPTRAEEHLTGKRPGKKTPNIDMGEVHEAAADDEPFPLEHESKEATLDSLDAQLDAAEQALNIVPIKRVEADLTLPNAVGPETHNYQTMAIHLYARRRST
jgi:16S rRNA (guanine(966)-N(2))-methyltransferase RsmD